VFLLGHWKNFDELESSLSLPELISLLTAKREQDKNHQIFLASLQGIDLTENRIKDQIDAELGPDDNFAGGMGFGYEDNNT